MENISMSAISMGIMFLNIYCVYICTRIAFLLLKRFAQNRNEEFCLFYFFINIAAAGLNVFAIGVNLAI